MAKGIGALIKKVSSIPGLIEEAIKEQQDKILEEVKGNFRKGKDPNGKTWKPLKSGKPATLYKTGHLYSSYDVVSNKNFIKIQNTAPYAKFHQNGTKYLPRRQVVPDHITEYIKIIISRAVQDKLKKIR